MRPPTFSLFFPLNTLSEKFKNNVHIPQTIGVFMSNKKSTSDNIIGDLIEVFLIVSGQFMLLSGKAIWVGLRRSMNSKRFLGLLLVTATLSFFLVLSRGHLHILHWLFPKFFDYPFLREIREMGFFTNFLGLTAFLTCAVSIQRVLVCTDIF